MPDIAARVHQALGAGGRALDADIVEELQAHAVAVYEAARAEGSTDHDAAARVDALIALWLADSDALRRRPRRRPVVVAPPAGRRRPLAGLAQDVRYAVRLLRRRPAFASLAVLTMALGIGATTTLFSVADGVLLKPLPWSRADQLIRISESRAGHTPRVRGTITNATFHAWRDRPSTIEALGGWRRVPATARVGSGDALAVQTAAVTPSLFAVLKAQPLAGRLFADDEGQGGKNVVVLSYGLWQDWFGGESAAIGTVVQIDGAPHVVVGVMPRGFAFPDRDTRAWTAWMPLTVDGPDGAQRAVIFPAMARLRSGATPVQAASEATARSRSAPDPGLAAVAMFGSSGPPDITAMPAVEFMTADVRPALLILLAAVALLLVTATANVSSLQLAGASARRREMAIRGAVGAGIGQLTRQLVVESIVVGAVGGVAGLLVAWMVHRALPSLLPADFPRAADIAIDGRVVAFSIAISMIASIVCGLLPAVHARRIDLVSALSDDGSAPVGSGLRSPTARARAIIMAGQVAVSCVLLVGASLLGRSFVALLKVDRGYEPTNVLTARLPLPSGYGRNRRLALLETITARLRATPGVDSAAYGNGLPLLSAGGFRAFTMRPPNNPSTTIEANAIQRFVSSGYFSALGIRLIAGRTLAETDTMTAPMVIVVNRSFATRYLAEDPGRAMGVTVPNLGVCRGDDDRWQVVGVVDDMRQGGVEETSQPEIYMPFQQVGCPIPGLAPVIVVRSHADPVQYVAALRAIVHAADPTVALDSVVTMEDRVMTTLARPRLYAVVLGGFGAFALAIMGVGLFGVLAYTVAQRAREIGVRTALGARPANIVALVLRQAAVVTAVGVAFGMAAALAASQLLTAVLYGVAVHDPVSFALVPIVLLVVTGAACVVPAWRAATLDPLQALRH